MKKKSKRSKLEDEFERQMRLDNVAQWVREHRFHDKRMWRLDFAWPDRKLAIEIEGGTFIQGRHARGAGIAKDCEKYNTATMLGWRVLRFTNKEVNNCEALHWIKFALSRIPPRQTNDAQEERNGTGQPRSTVDVQRELFAGNGNRGGGVRNGQPRAAQGREEGQRQEGRQVAELEFA